MILKKPLGENTYTVHFCSLWELLVYKCTFVIAHTLVFLFPLFVLVLRINLYFTEEITSFPSWNNATIMKVLTHYLFCKNSLKLAVITCDGLKLKRRHCFPCRENIYFIIWNLITLYYDQMKHRYLQHKRNF